MSKKILGLDLGVGSIGWALIETENNQPSQILGMGSRIVPISNDDSDQFQRGQAITKNADRTQRRTARKGYDRYQLRRALLTQVLRDNGKLPERMDEYVIDLWKLRAEAATEGHQLTLPQIGRVLYHINQKRGYKHSKADASADAKQTKYVQEVNQRYKDIQDKGLTIGQYFYAELQSSMVKAENGVYYTFRIKDKVFPRQAYLAEFDQIMAVQKAYYPDVLTEELIDTLRNRIIFYQRPLKSCKHLVSLCEFEMRPYKKADGSIIYSGPRCAPRTSPLAQLCAIWETVNNIKLTNKNNEEYLFSPEQRQAMVAFLQTHKEMKVTDLQKILGISKKDGWWGGKAIGKGIKGNQTLVQLREALAGQHEDLLRMDIATTDAGLVDVETGEVIEMVDAKVEQEPLFRLWHVVYSIQDKDELRKALLKQFGINDETILERLFNIDFVKPGYANKSHKFIRKILPYLMQGDMYSTACARVGINHSNSRTKEELAQRPLVDKIALLQKNALRQPVIEKILNQMINIVNALKDRYGEIDEVRVELARELKQNKEERESTFKNNTKNERLNKEIVARIQEMGIRPSRARIQKYKMWEESQHQCFYCGKVVSATEFLAGADVEVEHIIPRSVLFDDSFSNKVCACRECNSAKNNMTALDFMQTKPAAELEAYKARVDEAFQTHRISKTKRDHLLWHMEDIPQDFIDRQLRQSQYIATKAVEILQTAIRNVYATSGSVTDFLRHQWGYDTVLQHLNLPRYQQVEGMTELVTYDHCGQEHTEERIKDWSKRLDHRHHAVDALTIALTKQSYIQRLNTLNASREVLYQEWNESGAQTADKEKRTLLENWVSIQPHFDVQTVENQVSGILVSFRAGKRVTTPAKRAVYRGGKRVTVQQGLLVPRGALTEETVYGKLGDKFVVKYPLNHPSMKAEDIVDSTIRELVQARLAAFGNDAKKAFAMPLYSDRAQTMEIKSVRCYTGLQDKAMAEVRYNEQGQAIGFAKTGNNHHIAIYKDAQGQYQENVVSFWHAVERKRYGLPVVIDNPHAVWDILIDKNLPQDFMEKVPHDDWQFVTSLQVNEMFILGMDDLDFEMAIENEDYAALHKYLYRVQKVSSNDYYFRFHTETNVDDKYDRVKNLAKSKELKKVIWAGTNSLMNKNPHKVKITVLGQISLQ